VLNRIIIPAALIGAQGFVTVEMLHPFIIGEIPAHPRPDRIDRAGWESPGVMGKMFATIVIGQVLSGSLVAENKHREDQIDLRK